MSGSKRQTTSPTYLPDGFDLPDNYNILQISEIHAFEEPDWSRETYIDGIIDQINSYNNLYDLDELWILGDTGTFEDMNRILEGVDQDINVKVVAGDEDKKNEDCYTGWFEDFRTSSLQPFDVNLDYQIFDEGFETEIDGIRFQAAHHPTKISRDKELSSPDNRGSEFLDRLFSIGSDDNVNTLQQMPPHLEGVDLAVYNHAHMPYTRRLPSEELSFVLDPNERFEEGMRMLYGGPPEETRSKIAHGTGGRRNTYQRNKNEILPKRSTHMISISSDVLSTLHFNADNDQIFEHLAFDRQNDLEIYDVQASRYENQQSGYKLIQERFKPNKIDPDSHETPDQLPPYWENR